jgi:hypothetical protein
MSQNHPDYQHSVSFKPDVGSEYRYEVNEASETIQQVGNIKGKIVVSVKRKIEFLYKIKEGSIDGYIVEVKFLSTEVMTSVEGIQNDTSVLEEAEPRLKKMEGLTGCEFNLSLRGDGQINNIQRYNEYVAKCNFFREKALSESFFKEMFSQISAILPAHGAAKGSTWHVEQDSNDKIEYSNNEYKLETIYDGIAKVKKQALVKQELHSTQAPLSMIGSAQGDFEIELISGLVLNGNSARNLSGVTRVGEVEVTQSVVNNYEIKGQKI